MDSMMIKFDTWPKGCGCLRGRGLILSGGQSARCWKGQAQPKYKVGCGEARIRDGWDDAQGRKVGIVCIEVKPYLTIKPERCKRPGGEYKLCKAYISKLLK